MNENNTDLQQQAASVRTSEPRFSLSADLTDQERVQLEQEKKQIAAEAAQKESVRPTELGYVSRDVLTQIDDLAQEYRAMKPERGEDREVFYMRKEDVFFKMELLKLRRRWMARKEFKMPKQSASAEQSLTDIENQLAAAQRLNERMPEHCSSKEQLQVFIQSLQDAKTAIVNTNMM